MAGLRGNQAKFGFAKQTAKGTPATLGATTDVVPFTGGSIAPTRSVDNLSETDANRDRGVSFVSNFGVEGTPEFYVRDSNIHHVLQAALGAIATTGTVDFEHVITPANSLAYYTLYREIGGTLFEQFDDCMANELTISADAGQPLTASISWLGLEATRLASAPPALAAIANDAVYNFGEATVNLAGSVVATVSSFEFTLTNNTSQQQTDDFSFYDNVPGLREVTLGFTLVFETLAEYNRFHYGGIAGTTQSATLATVAANFEFSKGANNSVAFDFPSIAYEEFPVDPDPAGAPITVDVRASAQRGPSPVVTATVNNQEAT